MAPLGPHHRPQAPIGPANTGLTVSTSSPSAIASSPASRLPPTRPKALRGGLPPTGPAALTGSSSSSRISMSLGPAASASSSSSSSSLAGPSRQSPVSIAFPSRNGSSSTARPIPTGPAASRGFDELESRRARSPPRGPSSSSSRAAPSGDIGSSSFRSYDRDDEPAGSSSAPNSRRYGSSPPRGPREDRHASRARRSPSPGFSSYKGKDRETDRDYLSHLLPNEESSRSKISISLPGGHTRDAQPPRLESSSANGQSQRPALQTPPPPPADPGAAPPPPSPPPPLPKDDTPPVSLPKDSWPPSPPITNGHDTTQGHEPPDRPPTPPLDDPMVNGNGHIRPRSGAQLGTMRSAKAPFVPPEWTQRRAGAGNFYVLHDPQIHGIKGGPSVIKRKDGDDGSGKIEPPSDPRLKHSVEERTRGRGSLKNRAFFHEVTYKWDEHSTGTKPPPPPTAVLVTGLSPLTTTEQIRKYFRAYGRIKELDVKMDARSGMQLGICWVQFEDAPGAPDKGMSGHDIANKVCRVCDGQRISLMGEEKIKVVLDGRRIRTKQAVEEEMKRRYPPRPTPKPEGTPVSVVPTPAQKAATPALSSTGAATPQQPQHASTSGLPVRPNGPAGAGASSATTPMVPPRGPVAGPSRTPYNGAPQSRFGPRPTVAYTNMQRGGPPPPPSMPIRPSTYGSRLGSMTTQQLSSSFTDAPFSYKPPSRRDDGSDRYVPRGRSRTRSPSPRRYRRRAYSHSTGCSTCSSDSEDDRRYRRRAARSPIRRGLGGRGNDAAAREKEEQVRKEDDEKAKAALAENGRPAVYIEERFLPTTPINEEYLRDHFKAFRPARILRLSIGWYLFFSDDTTAVRSKSLLDNTLVQGRKILLAIKEPPSSQHNRSTIAPVAAPQEKSWKMLTFAKKNKALPAVVKKPSARPAPAAKSRRFSYSSSEDSEDEAPRPSRARSSSSPSSSEDEADREPLAAAQAARANKLGSLKVPVPTAESERDADAEEGEPELDGDLDTIMKEESTAVKPTPASKKRPAPKGKAGKAVKKAKIAPEESKSAAEAKAEPESAAADLKAEEGDASIIHAVSEAPNIQVNGKTKSSKPKKPAASALDKLIADGAIVDEEDVYWLSRALAADEGADAEPSGDEDDAVLPEEHPLHHTSGSWRAQGLKKIPQVQKSVYLPQRNRAAKTEEDASALTSGRTARVTGRRLANDMESHRKTVAATTDTDLFAFNQLRIRKKQLKFARSAIEGYGLYAMETIHQGEMVCEYVGELIRSSVADLREHKYLKQGIGSSYLFRIDGDVVCDATFRGSVSRLINHSCDPSASAKIISINGQSKIVIYAKRSLHPGEEILYDYKFPLESDPELRVPCLCGAETCRGWLN